MGAQGWGKWNWKHERIKSLESPFLDQFAEVSSVVLKYCSYPPCIENELFFIHYIPIQFPIPLLFSVSPHLPSHLDLFPFPLSLGKNSFQRDSDKT